MTKGVAQWLDTVGAGLLLSLASPPVDPTSPMCSPRDDNHNTTEPPPSMKEAGFRFQPISTRDPRASNLWGGCGHAGGGRRVVREGPRPWEARTCPERLRTRQLPAAKARAPHPGSRLVQLPSASSAWGWARQGALPPRKTCQRRPIPRERGQSQITIVPRVDQAGRKVSGPYHSGVRQGRKKMGCRAGG